SLSSVNYIKSNSRNILFFNTVDKKAHWLFPNNDQVIVNVRFITYPAGGVRLSSDSTQQKVTTSILIASEDRAPLAAGSKRLQNLFIALSDDYKLTPVVEGIDSILGHHQTSENNLLIFYLTNGAAKVIDYDLAARKVTSDTLLTAQ
ncbi:MAG TPA: hypothetical protein DCY07_04945, partial [Rhodospirillaceae bacterium]|nr:hypothetical protein [Rhodospirillaceae bacterium]